MFHLLLEMQTGHDMSTCIAMEFHCSDLLQYSSFPGLCLHCHLAVVVSLQAADTPSSLG